MKKVIIVLLITVLAAGMAFAGTFKGSAGIEFSVNFDDQEWGFKNTTVGKYTFKFEFDSTKVSIGEDHKTDVWAELAAEASAWVALSNAGLANNADFSAKYTAKITKANIHVGEITFGILNAGKAADFAASYYDDNGDGAPDYNVIKCVGTAPGFTVSYKDWKGGFGAKGTWNPDDSDLNTYQIFAHVETPTFKFADEAVTVDAGAYAFAIDKNYVGALYTNFGGGFKAAYAADKLSVSLGTDLQYFKLGDEGKFGFEVAANATYDFVSLDVYLAPGAFFPGYTDDDPLKLDACLSAAYTFDLNEDIALDVDGYVEVRDALIKDLTLFVGSSQSTTIDAFTILLAEDATFVYLANPDEDLVTILDITAKVTYKHEKFTAYAKLTPGFLFDKDDDTDTLYTLGFEAGISTDAIVEGAVLALTYKKADFSDFENNKGVVTASCTINF
ncbi:MAG: hypothetical protein J5800_08660 [Spirochaetales bacterium]|nr:hypothetical protein [Spirochaetales bacterium]